MSEQPWSVPSFKKASIRAMGRAYRVKAGDRQQADPQAAIPGALASRYIRVPALARFEATLSRLEKASALALTAGLFPAPGAARPCSGSASFYRPTSPW